VKGQWYWPDVDEGPRNSGRVRPATAACPTACQWRAPSDGRLGESASSPSRRERCTDPFLRDRFCEFGRLSYARASSMKSGSAFSRFPAASGTLPKWSASWSISVLSVRRVYLGAQEPGMTDLGRERAPPPRARLCPQQLVQRVSCVGAVAKGVQQPGAITCFYRGLFPERLRASTAYVPVHRRANIADRGRVRGRASPAAGARAPPPRRPPPRPPPMDTAPGWERPTAVV